MAGPKVGVLHLLLHVICLNVVFLSCDDSHDSSGLKGSIVLGWVGVDAYILHLSSVAMLTELYVKWDMVKVDVMMHYVS